MNGMGIEGRMWEIGFNIGFWGSLNGWMNGQSSAGRRLRNPPIWGPSLLYSSF
jgi:hypothetical protein